MPLTIIGNYLSPYVRKVLVCLEMKGVSYEIDPFIPFFGNDDFTRLNPLRRIPVLVDGDLVLTESSVICEYLDERFPEPRLLPGELEARSRARSLQAYADGYLGELLIWRIYNERIIKRFVWQQPTNEAVLRQALEKDLPRALDYLESVVPADGYLFGTVGVADIAIAAMFRNAAFASCEIDDSRWPKTAAFVARVLAQPAFECLQPFERIMMKVPIPQHREALRDAGAPITSKTMGTDTPQPSQFHVAR